MVAPDGRCECIRPAVRTPRLTQESCGGFPAPLLRAVT